MSDEFNKRRSRNRLDELTFFHMNPTLLDFAPRRKIQQGREAVNILQLVELSKVSNPFVEASKWKSPTLDGALKRPAIALHCVRPINPHRTACFDTVCDVE